MQIIGYAWEAVVYGLGLIGLVAALTPASPTADTEFDVVKTLGLEI